MFRIVRRFAEIYKHTYEKVLVTCKDITHLKDDKLTSYFGKREHLESFFKSLPYKVRSMQTSDITALSGSLSKFQPLASLNPHFWQEITAELCKRAYDLELPETIDLIHTFSQVNTEKSTIKALYAAMCKVLEEFDYSEYKEIPLHKLEQVLADYSLKNLGSGMLYEILSETIMGNREFSGLAYQHLAKLAYYFSRAEAAKKRSAKFIQATEEIIWNAIHQGQIKEMEEITGVISYIVPGNIGSNDLKALLEFTLFRFLADPKNQITISRLVQVLSSFTHYIITYKPLDLLLKQLVKDSLPLLNPKELIQVLWAYSRHNKAEPEFVLLLLSRAAEIVPSSNLSFRHFTYLLNSIVNTNCTTPEVSAFANAYSLKCLETQTIQDHYLIKALSLTPAGTNIPFKEAGIQELLITGRLPASHPTDLSRAFVLLAESQDSLTQEATAKLLLKLPDAIDNMKPQHVARCVYALSKMNLAEPRHYKLLEQKILATDLVQMPPQDLGVSCLAFGQVGLLDFCHKALGAVNDCFHKYQKREYQDYSDTDQEDYTPNKLILINEQDLDFTKEIPASTVVQMTWMAAALGVSDKIFWNDKLLKKIRNIRVTPQEFSLNHWAWTAKTLREEEDVIEAVDPFHFALRMQVLAIVTGDFEEDNSLVAKNSKAFLEDVVNVLKNAGGDVKESDGRIEVNGRKVFMYENQHYVYGTSGFLKQSSAEGLLTTVKLQKVIEEKMGKQIIEVFRGQWMAMSTKEKLKMFTEILNR